MVTTNAGTGTLCTIIEGPSKCAIVCNEVEEGYAFTWTPMAPGDYLINIKYSNVTIAGCPTKAVVDGKSNRCLICRYLSSWFISCLLFSFLLLLAVGSGKPSAFRETSSLAVETVEKKPGQSSAKKYKGDASKVVIKGNGLKNAFANRPAMFTVDVKDAGESISLLSIN